MRFTIFSLGAIATILIAYSVDAITGSAFDLSNEISETPARKSLTSRGVANLAISGDAAFYRGLEATKARRDFLARRALGHAIHKRNSSSHDIKQSDGTQSKKDDENENEADENEDKEDENENEKDEESEDEDEDDESEDDDDESEDEDDESEDEDDESEDENEDDENENDKNEGNKDQDKKSNGNHNSSNARRSIL